MRSLTGRLTFLTVLSFVGLPCLLFAAPMSALLPNRTVTYALPYTFTLMLALSSFTVVFLGPRKAVLAAILLLFLSTSVIAARSGSQAAAVAAGVVYTLLPVLPFLATALILSSSCPGRLRPLALTLAFGAYHGACMSYRSVDRKTLPSWTNALDLQHCHAALAIAYHFVLLTAIFNRALSLLPPWVQEKQADEPVTPEEKEHGRLDRLAAFLRRHPMLQPILVLPGILILVLNDRICIGPILSMTLWLSPAVFSCTFLAVPQFVSAAASLLGITVGIFSGFLLFSKTLSVLFLSFSLSPALIVAFWSIVPACTSGKAKRVVITTTFVAHRLLENGTTKIQVVSRSDLSCIVALSIFSLLFFTLEIILSLCFRKLEAHIQRQRLQLSIKAEEKNEEKKKMKVVKGLKDEKKKKEEEIRMGEKKEEKKKVEKIALVNVV